MHSAAHSATLWVPATLAARPHDRKQMINAKHEFEASPAFGRRVHMWTYGHAGRPVIAFPTAGGYAHEWEHHGVIKQLSDWLSAGQLRLYCPETNAAAVWIHPEAGLKDRMALARAYERFVVEELVPRARRETGRDDVVAIGCSVGALYAANMALKHPDEIAQAICLSGRYRATWFTQGRTSDELYYNDPSAFVWNLQGDHLERVRRRTRLTLVCGQGAHEERCLAETRHLASGLAKVGVPTWLDLWGHDVAHEWQWWRRQIRYHLALALRGG